MNKLDQGDLRHQRVTTEDVRRYMEERAHETPAERLRREQAEESSRRSREDL